MAVSQHTGVELQYDGGSEEKVTYWLERQKNNFPQFQWTPQSSGHLGERMRDAFKKAFKEGAKTVVLVSMCIMIILFSSGNGNQACVPVA